MINKLHTKPSADGFYMPAEYSKHKGCLMIWPERPGSWNYGAKNARVAFTKIAEEIAKSEEVYMLVSENAFESAKEALGQCQGIHLIVAKTDDAWARDTGATFVIRRKDDKNSENKRERRAVDWQFNAWGGEYDGLYAHGGKWQALLQMC